MPFLKDSTSKLSSLIDVECHLKVFLFAHDHKIELQQNKEIDWTALMKRLIERGEEERRLIVRLLRYLKVKGMKEHIEEISLLMMNTLNKVKRAC